jgi:hypothetical protein
MSYSKKILKIILWSLLIAILVIFSISCLFGMLFIMGVWYKDAFMD